MRLFASSLCLLWALLPSGAAAEQAREENRFLDPLIVDPENYFLELENDSLRVLRERLASGERAAMHSHRARVSVSLKDARVTLTPRGGEPETSTHVAGATFWSEPVTHEGTVHSDVENLSIELKELKGAEVPVHELDAVEVDPEHHVVDFENDRVRVVRMTYPPGTSTPPHTHRAGFGVFLTDAHGRNVPEKGDVVPIEAEAGSTFWTEGGGPPHVTENLGEEELIVLLVEMKKLPR